MDKTKIKKSYIIEDGRGGIWDGSAFRGPLFAKKFIKSNPEEDENLYLDLIKALTKTVTFVKVTEIYDTPW